MGYVSIDVNFFTWGRSAHVNLQRSSDQFCSLAFTLSNLYFTFCAYRHDFQPTVWERCGTQSRTGWLVSFVLAMLPLLARLVQSVRRYADSKLITHLINVSQPYCTICRKEKKAEEFTICVQAGKYGAGIIYYFFYYFWRHHGECIMI